MDVRRLGRSAAGVFLAGTLLLGAAACGDDDEDDVATPADEEVTEDGTESETESEEATETESESETEATAQTASAEFCDGLVAFNQGVFEVELDDQSTTADVQAVGERMVPLWDEVRNNAPEELQGELQPLSEAVDKLAEGDASAFNADETFQTYTSFVDDAVGQCGFENVTVTAVDYAFEGVPETMPAGTVALELVNESEGEPHEFVALKKNDPEMTTEDLLALPEDQIESAITFVGASFAEPGQAASSLVTLEPGEYVAVCYLPVGGTEEGAPHVTEGMYVDFTVE